MDFLSPEYLKFLDRRGQFSESDIEKVSLFCVGDNDDNDDGMSNGMIIGHPQDQFKHLSVDFRVPLWI